MRKKLLLAGGALMVLLGLARGAGGLALLARGGAADANIRADGFTVTVTGATLLALGVVLAVAGVGVLRRGRLAWLAGGLLTVAFVLGGVLNGIVLYGRPGVAGTIANVIVAAAIIACLWLGRGALKEQG